MLMDFSDTRQSAYVPGVNLQLPCMHLHDGMQFLHRRMQRFSRFKQEFQTLVEGHIKILAILRGSKYGPNAGTESE